MFIFLAIATFHSNKIWRQLFWRPHGKLRFGADYKRREEPFCIPWQTKRKNMVCLKKFLIIYFQHYFILRTHGRPVKVLTFLNVRKCLRTMFVLILIIYIVRYRSSVLPNFRVLKDLTVGILGAGAIGSAGKLVFFS